MPPSRMPIEWNPQRLRMAADAAGVGLFAWDVDSDEIDMDGKSHDLWGVNPDDGTVTFEELSSRIHPQDMDRVRAAFTATREIEGAYEIDFRIILDRKVRWVSARGQGEDRGIVGRVTFGIFLDVSERKIAEETRELLASEMGHRVKNLFAIAAALTAIASRSSSTPEEMAEDLTRRLRALGQAHELVVPRLSEQRKATQLGELLALLLSAYDDTDEYGGRIRVSVPDVLVGEGSVTTLALVVHELATNALKYGALSRPAGYLEVTCNAGESDIEIIWTEKGGPPVSLPKGEPGFGSELVRMSVNDQLGGTIEFEWPPEGLIVRLGMSRARLGV